MASLSLVAAPGHLADVSAAREHWEGARDREQLARAVLVAAVEDARTMGAKLTEIAGAMGVTRQAVQKILREAEQVRREDAAVRARYAPGNAKRALGRSSGWGSGSPQCSGCKSFISHPGAQCSQCGYLDGAGYVGVPAQTSHLERWR